MRFTARPRMVSWWSSSRRRDGVVVVLVVPDPVRGAGRTHPLRGRVVTTLFTCTVGISYSLQGDVGCPIVFGVFSYRIRILMYRDVHEPSE